MKKFGKFLGRLLLIILAVGLCGALYLYLAGFGFARSVNAEEEALRLQLVEQAQTWLGSREDDGSHEPIIDVYNAHTPLARGYAVQYTDNWCATFVSAAAISCGITDIIPTECGCEKQIELFMELDCWIEDDSYVPLPGDIIYYCNGDMGLDDCTDWSDHVGIVVGTAGPLIKVIEGNYGDAVGYRYLFVDAMGIRGYGIPNYSE